MERSDRPRSARPGGWPGAVLLVVSLVAVLVVAIGEGTAGADPHAAALSLLEAGGILKGTGCVDGSNCPEEPIPRWVMAVWLIRALGESHPTLEGPSRFSDVSSTDWFAAHVERLAVRGITLGCRDGYFCPESPVTRAQMAAFLTRAFHLEGYVMHFVDTSHTSHLAAIGALAAEGITGGCSTDPPRYCPDRHVTRGQMATFLARALDLVPRPQVPPVNPGESYIAFGTPSGYWVTNLSGTDRRRYDSDPGSFSFSPDGTAVAFHQTVSAGWASRRRGTVTTIPAVFLMDTDTGRAVQLSENGQHPNWSADGTRIIYEIEFGSAAKGIWVMNADGSDQRLIQQGRRPTWSPDGQRIAYYGQISTDAEGAMWSRVQVMNPDGTGQRQLSSRFQLTGPTPRVVSRSFRINIEVPVVLGDLAWSPDGASILYRRLNLDNPPGRTWELWTVKADGTQDRRLAYGDEGSWSPDGTKIAYTDDHELWIMNANGSRKRRLAEDGIHPAWSPDGSRIAYTITHGVDNTYSNTDYELWVVDTDGSNHRKLADGYDPVWLPATTAVHPPAFTVDDAIEDIYDSRFDPSTNRSTFEFYVNRSCRTLSVTMSFTDPDRDVTQIFHNVTDGQTVQLEVDGEPSIDWASSPYTSTCVYEPFGNE